MCHETVAGKPVSCMFKHRSEGTVNKVYDKCRIKSSLSKLLFSVLLQQSKFRHYSLSKSSSSFGEGAYLRGGLFEGGANSRIYGIRKHLNK